MEKWAPLVLAAGGDVAKVASQIASRPPCMSQEAAEKLVLSIWEPIPVGPSLGCEKHPEVEKEDEVECAQCKKGLCPACAGWCPQCLGEDGLYYCALHSRACACGSVACEKHFAEYDVCPDCKVPSCTRCMIKCASCPKRMTTACECEPVCCDKQHCGDCDCPRKKQKV